MESKTLYHVTTRKYYEAIEKDGLKENTFLSGSEEMAVYYAETIEDEGEEPIVLTIDLDELLRHVEEKYIEADHNSIAEPITTVLGSDEDEVYEEWEESDGSWRASLEIVDSIIVRHPIPHHIIRTDQFSYSI